MIIQRWLAPIKPSFDQIKFILENEGLDVFTETVAAGEKVKDHRHPFSEVRFIISGELMFNVAGNQFLLRNGDRVEVPANTKHWHSAQGSENCICLVANKLA
jgi:quercetin dioxygenase-like cupin family protein